MVGTKEKLNGKGNVVCHWGEDWWWDALQNEATPVEDIDWSWEARCNYSKELALKFISDYDLWEQLKEIVRDALASTWSDEDAVREMLAKEGIVALAHTEMIDDLINDMICWDSEDMAKEYVEWLM
ncbi:MAG: hypothetical protein IIY21_22750 [Clostridiales bacterium]|nr:hypothetical protein [Clostridiales bacterium]